MKHMVISAAFGLVVLPFLATQASAANKSTKDAGWGGCVNWCAENRKGKELDKCVDNCDCYYKTPQCKKSANPALQGNVSPPSTPGNPGVIDPGPRTPSTAPFSKSGMKGPILQRGVDGEQPPLPEKEGK